MVKGTRVQLHERNKFWRRAIEQSAESSQDRITYFTVHEFYTVFLLLLVPPIRLPITIVIEAGGNFGT